MEKMERLKLLEKQCDIHVVSSSINIQKASHRRQVQVQSNSKFFSEDVLVSVDEESIRFTKPSLDYRGKTHKPKELKSGWYTFCIVAELPITKNLEFDDEESTEDELVVYYCN